MALTADGIREYLAAELGVDTAGVENDTALFSSNVLDSFSMVDLIVYVETAGGFRMKPSQVNLDNLDSIDRMLAFAAKQAS